MSIKITPDARRTEYGLPPETPAQAEAAGKIGRAHV